MPRDDAFMTRKAAREDIDAALALVTRYHAFEGIETSEALRRKAVHTLIETPHLGAIHLIEQDGRVIGYVAICYGFALEFGGRDAFIDEFFIEEDARGRGLGGALLDRLIPQLRAEGLKALHLEVAREAAAAQRLYRRCGFEPRGGYDALTLILEG